LAQCFKNRTEPAGQTGNRKGNRSGLITGPDMLEPMKIRKNRENRQTGRFNVQARIFIFKFVFLNVRLIIFYLLKGALFLVI
jgi:hypothetical protein